MLHLDIAMKRRMMMSRIIIKPLDFVFDWLDHVMLMLDHVILLLICMILLMGHMILLGHMIL